MSHVTGNEPEDHRADLDWLYRQDQPASGYASGGPQTLLLPPPTIPASPPATRRPVIIMIVLLLCLTAGAVAGMVLLLQPQSPTAWPDFREPSAAKVSDASQEGRAGPVTPTQVKVGCQAPDATDGAGRPVSYVPEQLIDGKLDTAWRCNGNGIGQVAAFTLPAGTTIAEVGLVNGYAKVDPASGARRYGEYRRITQVTWTFANGMSFQQSLTDGVKTLQKLSIPAQAGDTVTLTINSSTQPGSRSRGRDAVLISEVSFRQA